MRAYELAEQIFNRQSKNGTHAYLTKKQAQFLADLCRKEGVHSENPPKPILGRIAGSGAHSCFIQCSFGILGFGITDVKSGTLVLPEYHLPAEEKPIWKQKPQE